MYSISTVHDLAELFGHAALYRTNAVEVSPALNQSSHLFRCAVKQSLQLVLSASLMSCVEDVDFRLGARWSAGLRQLPTNVVITFFQILHRTFLGKRVKPQTLNIMDKERYKTHGAQFIKLHLLQSTSVAE